MTNHRQTLGKWGEAAAAAYLTQLGYQVCAQNVRTPYGEIDLVAEKQTAVGEKVVVFVEVKTRTNTIFGDPEESVNPKKQMHLLKCAQHYIQQYPEQADEWRIDVITILRRHPDLPPVITHFEDAVGSE